MKTGDKVYCIPLNRDVIIVNQCNGRYDVYDEKSEQYSVSCKSDLLEYDVKSSPRVSQKTTVAHGYVAPQNKTNIGGEIKMNIKGLLGEFGKVKNNEVAMTFDGKIVVKRANGEYVRFNEEKEQIENHMNLVFEGASKFAYIMPVASVEIGDVIKVKGKFYQVLAVNTNGSIVGINLTDGTKSTICKETNAFGINFYYKVTSFLGDATTATAGGINPMMLLLMDKENGSSEDLLPLLLMGGMGQTGTAGAINPLVMMSLLGKGGNSDDLLPLLLMGGMSATGTDTNAMNPLLMMALLNK